LPRPARKRRISVAKRKAWLASAGVAFAGVSAILLLLAAPWDRGGGTPPRPRAVIVDQLAYTDANPDFAAEAERDLRAAGYDVDYYPSKAVTVEFYRELPSRGYGFVLLRSHSTQFIYRRDPVTSELKQAENSVMLFTTEPYSQVAHADEQRSGRVAVGSYPDHQAEGQYFLIDPTFVANAMHGQFKNATVVLMGCGGLSTTDLAKAFEKRGAKEFISWDTSVTAAHTDAAARKLLAHLLGDTPQPNEAVARTMAEVGPDPSFGSKLLAYP
jgi:hypothetical protein